MKQRQRRRFVMRRQDDDRFLRDLVCRISDVARKRFLERWAENLRVRVYAWRCQFGDLPVLAPLDKDAT